MKGLDGTQPSAEFTENAIKRARYMYGAKRDGQSWSKRITKLVRINSNFKMKPKQSVGDNPLKA